MDGEKAVLPPDAPLANYTLIAWIGYAVKYILWVLFYPILFFF